MANIHSTRLFVVTTTLMIASIITMNAQVATAAAALPPASVGQQQFSGMIDLIRDCALYMHIAAPKMIKPDQKCCTSLKKVNVLQFCQMFVTYTEEVFSPRNVAHVAKMCNSPLPLNSKCGSKSQYFISPFYLNYSSSFVTN